MSKFIIYSLIFHVFVFTGVFLFSKNSFLDFFAEFKNDLLDEVELQEEEDDDDEGEELVENEQQENLKKELKKNKKIQKLKKETVLLKRDKTPEVTQIQKKSSEQSAFLSEIEKPLIQEQVVKSTENFDEELLEPLDEFSEKSPKESLDEVFEKPLKEDLKNKPEIKIAEKKKPMSNNDLEEYKTPPRDEDIPLIAEKPLQPKKIPPQEEIKNHISLIEIPGNPQIIYPQIARKQKQEGSVVILYFVDDAGLVDQIQLLESSGFPDLDNEALRIYSRYQYLPGQSGWYKQQVNFKLKQS